MLGHGIEFAAHRQRAFLRRPAVEAVRHLLHRPRLARAGHIRNLFRDDDQFPAAQHRVLFVNGRTNGIGELLGALTLFGLLVTGLEWHVCTS
jgi:hypothetical protein